MPVDLRAQVVHHALADDVGQPGLADAQHRRWRPRCRSSRRPATNSSSSSVVGDRDVEDVAQQERRDHRQDRRDRDQDQDGEQPPAVGPEERERSGAFRSGILGLPRRGRLEATPSRGSPPPSIAPEGCRHTATVFGAGSRASSRTSSMLMTGWKDMPRGRPAGTSSRSPRLRSGRITVGQARGVRGQDLLLEAADRQHAALQRDLAGHADRVLDRAPASAATPARSSS